MRFTRAFDAARYAADVIGRDRIKKTAITAGAVGAAGILTGASVAIGAALFARAAWNAVLMDSLRGKIALVTGASRGLGFAIAQELARQGCDLAICARDEEELNIAAAQLRASGRRVLPIVCDVAKQDQVNSMIERATQELGRIDVLVNNAGIISVGPIESQTVEDFREAMDVMYWGQVYPTLAVLPQMQQRRSGWIANVTSIGGKISVPHLIPYCGAKFAAVGFSEGLTAELAKDNIKVTTVVPGLMRTGSHENAFFKGDNQKEYAWFSLGATSPLTAIGARRAARSIVNAIRRGQAEIILSLPAKAAALFHGVFPGTTAHLAGLSNRYMPGTGSTSKERYLGKESESAITRSPLTALGRKAASELNQRVVPHSSHEPQKSYGT